jgi:inner membrane protein
MDNLTHSLAGAALSKTRLGALHPRAATVLVLAANIADIDIVAALWGRESYLVHHRGITHSLCGTVVLCAALAACVRWIDARGSDARASWSALFLLCGAGLVSHPLLDYLNNYGVRPWLPFDARWYYGDLVFIAEPWLWLIFGAITALAGTRTRSGSLALATAAAIATTAIYASGQISGAFAVFWPCAIAALAFARWFGWGSARPPRVLAPAGLALLAFLALQVANARRARSVALDDADSTDRAALDARRVIATPQPADAWHWTVLVSDANEIVQYDISLAPVGTDEPIAARGSMPRNYDDRAVRLALASDVTAWWRSFVRVGYAETFATERGTFVQLFDARYRAAWCSVAVLVREDGQVEALGDSAGSASPARLGSGR